MTAIFESLSYYYRQFSGERERSKENGERTEKDGKEGS